MSIRILVLDRNSRPAPKVRVFIKWKGGGTSSGSTDGNGEFNTNVNSRSTIDELNVDDSNAGQSGRELSDSQMLTVHINRSVA